jgi:hypothetical protein
MRSPTVRSIALAVRGASGMVTTAALAGDNKGPVPPLDAQGLNAGASGFGDTQPVERQQRDQRVLVWRAQPGGDQQRAEFVAVQPGGVRLIVQTRSAHVSGRRMIQHVFLDRVPVEPSDGAQPPGDSGPRAASGLQIAGETLDVGAAGLEQAQVVLVAPARVLTQVQCVRFAGQAAVAGQEPG